MKCSLLVLSSYLDGELEARRQGELEAHLVGCQRCRSGLGYLREEVERISTLGRVGVAEHSVHSLLSQLGLIEEDEALPARDQVATAAAPPSWLEEPQPAWHDNPRMPSSRDALDENSVDMTGTPQHGTPFWQPPEVAPTVPHAAVPPAPPPATAAPPPDEVRQWPPPASDLQPDDAGAPPAPVSAGAFPPGGPEPPEASDPPDDVTASGGDPAMTASPPWTPREAPPEPLYPLTDEDVLDEPMAVERFGPPQQARPSLFERLRDRIAVRRALSRSAGDFDDSVQIVSGSGAPLRTGRGRAEVERRRQEGLHMQTAGMPGDDDLDAAEPGDEVDLGPLPATAPFVNPGAAAHMPRPGQLAIPGTEDHPARQVMGTPLPRHDAPAPPPSHHAMPPLPPARHSLEAAIGAPPPMSPPPPVPRPPAMAPSAPVPDPLAEALQEYERGRGGRDAGEPRPWRPREIPEDVVVPAAEAAAPPVEPRPERAAPGAADRSRRSPAQMRESRRLLALFGAAALVMLIVGIVSGRTSTPLPSSTSTSSSSQPAPAQHPASKPAAKAPAAPAPSAAAPRASSAPAAAGPAGSGPQLTGVKTLGDSGTGYQVKDFRYGEHPNDFRIVLDMDAAGSASGTPKVTVGFVDPTTVDVVIAGTVPAGSTGSLPAGSPVSGITLVQPSPFANAITYQIKLSHAMTFSAGYITGPLRLVLDLAG